MIVTGGATPPRRPTRMLVAARPAHRPALPCPPRHSSCAVLRPAPSDTKIRPSSRLDSSRACMSRFAQHIRRLRPHHARTNGAGTAPRRCGRPHSPRRTRGGRSSQAPHRACRSRFRSPHPHPRSSILRGSGSGKPDRSRAAAARPPVGRSYLPRRKSRTTHRTSRPENPLQNGRPHVRRRSKTQRHAHGSTRARTQEYKGRRSLTAGGTEHSLAAEEAPIDASFAVGHGVLARRRAVIGRLDGCVDDRDPPTNRSHLAFQWSRLRGPGRGGVSFTNHVSETAVQDFKLEEDCEDRVQSCWDTHSGAALMPPCRRSPRRIPGTRGRSSGRCTRPACRMWSESAPDPAEAEAAAGSTRPSPAASAPARAARGSRHLAAGETVILLHPLSL